MLPIMNHLATFLPVSASDTPLTQFIKKIKEPQIQEADINHSIPELLQALKEAIQENKLDQLAEHPKLKDRFFLYQNDLVIRKGVYKDFDGRLLRRFSDIEFEKIPLTFTQVGNIPNSVQVLDQMPSNPDESPIPAYSIEQDKAFQQIIPLLRKALDEQNQEEIHRLCNLPESKDRMFLLNTTLLLRQLLYRDSDSSVYLRFSNSNLWIMYNVEVLPDSIPRVPSYGAGSGGSTAIMPGQYEIPETPRWSRY